MQNLILTVKDYRLLWQCIFIVIFLVMLLLPAQAQAQQKEVEHEEQLWFGYMTTARISNRFSVWNDFHYIPSGFGVARTGLTMHFPNRIDVTAGYAHVWLPLREKLRRHEHRPWAQVVVHTPLGGNFDLQHRLRWDLRYRQRVADGDIADGYTFNHRGRVQSVLRRNFPGMVIGGVVPSLVLANELLVNLGRQSDAIFDQNRISLMAGARYKGLLLQAGYMNRYVQAAAPGRFTSNHTLVVWLFHNLELRKQDPKP